MINVCRINNSFLFYYFLLYFSCKIYKDNLSSYITMITNYQEQYEFAKDTLLNAIKNGDNVLLYGAGANGKSHLVNEMKKIIEQNRYHTLDYISSSLTPYDWENYLKQHKVNKWIMCTNMLHSTIDTLSETTYIIINMNKFCYP